MIGLQIIVDIVFAYLLVRLWMERRKDTFRATSFDRESREAMETYRDELEDLLNRLESRIAEERRAIEAMRRGVNDRPAAPLSDLTAKGRVPAIFSVGGGLQAAPNPETRARDAEAVREKIREFDQEGLSAKEIARRTGSGTREVNLVLAMAKREERP
jgi:hypothetical protein